MSALDLYVLPVRPDWITYGYELVNVTAFYSPGMSRRQLIQAALAAGRIQQQTAPGHTTLQWRLLAMNVDRTVEYLSEPYTIEEKIERKLVVSEA